MPRGSPARSDRAGHRSALPAPRGAGIIDGMTEPGLLEPVRLDVDPSSSAASLRVRGLVTDERGRWLLVRDTRDDDAEWVLPGGRVDEGETPTAAIAREVSEEADLRVAVGRMLAVGWQAPGGDRTLPRVTVVFECRAEAAASADGADGHHEVRWVPPPNALASTRAEVAALLTAWWESTPRGEAPVFVEIPG